MDTVVLVKTLFFPPINGYASVAGCPSNNLSCVQCSDMYLNAL